MERVCFLLRVRREKLAEYKQCHAAVWEEMRRALSQTGWHNYSLFLRPDGLVVGYLETPDFSRSLALMAELDVNARWQAAMGPYFEDLEGKRPDQGMLRLEEIFHLE
jgi:L-rhamnose mutarotase